MIHDSDRRKFGSRAIIGLFQSRPHIELKIKFLHRKQTTMYLQCYINEKGEKVYTTKKESPLGLATESAHPARFSPDDKYSKQRVLNKKRFGILPTQGAPVKY
ncbi:unnamed protein product [Thlaspi arvense]|uniref:Nucleolar protein 10 n=1 Tax=Thlaspi arvense TaxID=13288 RepID=A0AAU9RTC4_THLAR|nr:unnamed protein product [Thlaspi arvense]